MIPTIGRSVHYVLPKGVKNAGAHRHAIISQVWDDEATERTQVQLWVTPDFMNDGENVPYGVRTSSQDPTGTTLGTWHEPERAKIPSKDIPARREKEREAVNA